MRRLDGVKRALTPAGNRNPLFTLISDPAVDREPKCLPGGTKNPAKSWDFGGIFRFRCLRSWNLPRCGSNRFADG